MPSSSISLVFMCMLWIPMIPKESCTPPDKDISAINSFATSPAWLGSQATSKWNHLTSSLDASWNATGRSSEEDEFCCRVDRVYKQCHVLRKESGIQKIEGAHDSGSRKTPQKSKEAFKAKYPSVVHCKQGSYPVTLSVFGLLIIFLDRSWCRGSHHRRSMYLGRTWCSA